MFNLDQPKFPWTCPNMHIVEVYEEATYLKGTMREHLKDMAKLMRPNVHYTIRSHEHWNESWGRQMRSIALIADDRPAGY